ncbi:hypothetical protein H0H87_011850 [Tephrocybe sp. NHM501043]|nr:hypothetical protein H0H87_011850 [Tephrocybe sp. NHM501043]
MTTTAEPTASVSISLSSPPRPKSPPPEASSQCNPPDPNSAPEAAEPQPESNSEPSQPGDTLESAGIIDWEIFNQILELDEDSTHDFSQGMAESYFAQAQKTFKDMDEALSKENLDDLSALGHFLKGSSAALGLSKVQESCEKIQHYGKKRDEEAEEEAEKDLTAQESLTRIKALRKQVEKDYGIAERWLKRWYETNVTTESEDDA